MPSNNALGMDMCRTNEPWFDANRSLHFTLNIGGLASESQRNLSGLVDAHRTRNGTYEFTKKIKFSLIKDELENQIRDLNDATFTLRKIRELGTKKMDVALQSTSQPATRFTSAVASTQQYAKWLYSAIATGYAVGCHPVHEVRLWLSSRAILWDRKKGFGVRKPAVAFTVAFSPDDADEARMPRYITEVEVLEEELDACQDRGQTQKHVKVTIQEPAESCRVRPKSLQDLCDSIAQARGDSQSLQLYLSRDGHLCYLCQPLKSDAHEVNIVEGKEDILSLEDILLQTAEASPPSALRLTLNQRMGLAFNIASSMMQLHSTSWLCAPITSRALYFERGTELCMCKRTPPSAVFLQPFIRHEFTTVAEDNCANSPCGPKRCMLDLGIVLLELWHAKTFSTYLMEEGLHLDNSLGSRYDMAVRWLNSSTYHILPFYLDVVTRCIECTFATNSVAPEWRDIMFRKSVYEHVLKPLWDNCPAELR
ncbi:hypothetical protein IFM62136_05456 [Aspergillus lentulus]|nr:hypothetical protein IFM62136_05456 [Aspergillus lentulus]